MRRRFEVPEIRFSCQINTQDRVPSLRSCGDPVLHLKVAVIVYTSMHGSMYIVKNTCSTQVIRTALKEES